MNKKNKCNEEQQETKVELHNNEKQMFSFVYIRLIMHIYIYNCIKNNIKYIYIVFIVYCICYYKKIYASSVSW